MGRHKSFLPSYKSPPQPQQPQQPHNSCLTSLHYYHKHNTMQASQMSDLHYYLLQPDFCDYPCDSSSIISSPNLASFSSNSTTTTTTATTDEAEVSIINERKQRRMISNRESARRSRIRKQRQLDELWSQVVWLRNENHQLLDRLNDSSENRDRLAEENAQLKQEVSELRQMLLNNWSPFCYDSDPLLHFYIAPSIAPRQG